MAQDWLWGKRGRTSSRQRRRTAGRAAVGTAQGTWRTAVPRAAGLVAAGTAQGTWRTAVPRAAGLAAATTAAVFVASCSSAPPPQVASLPGHHATTGTTGQLTQSQSDQDMVDFARCMRAHGVDMPDPYHRTGHAGLSIDIPSTGPGDRGAMTACQHFLQPIIQMKQGHQRAIAAPRLHALTEYARCMRAHDIPMLDPDQYGGLSLGNVPGINSDYGRYSPQFRTADTACRHLLPPHTPDDGSGP